MNNENNFKHQKSIYQKKLNRFYSDFSDFNFIDKFKIAKMKNADYNKLVNIYYNYDGIDLINLSKQMIIDTDKIIKHSRQYPTSDYNQFKNQFNNVLLNFLNRQVNGHGGEQLVANLLWQKAGIKPLLNINLPCSYLSYNATNHFLSSNQIDAILVCNYGIFIFEVKNINAEFISIEGDTPSTEPVWDTVKEAPVNIDKQLIHIYRNQTDITKYTNDIGRQTYYHKQALIKILGEDSHNYFNKAVLNYKIYSVLVYVDEHPKENRSPTIQFLGNRSNADANSSWYVTGLSPDNCWQWITTHDAHNLSPEEVNEFNTTIKEYSHKTMEKQYSHLSITPDIPARKPSDFQLIEGYYEFLKKWHHFNHQFQ